MSGLPKSGRKAWVAGESILSVTDPESDPVRTGDWYCRVGASSGRGDDWVVRDNFLHDWRKNGGNFVSYGVFLKSGGKRDRSAKSGERPGSAAPPAPTTRCT